MFYLLQNNLVECHQEIKNDLMSKSPIMNKPKYFYEMNSSGKRQLIPENKIREYMQSKNK
jgi:hypothetical protein